ENSKTAVESVESALHRIRQLNEDWNNRFTFERPNLLERYVRGGIGFHLKFRTGSSPQGDPLDLYTVFEGLRVTHGLGGRQFDSESGIRRIVFDDGDDVAESERVAHDHKKAVFVCDIEVVDDLQNGISRIRRPVWLQSLDQGTMSAGDPLYYSV